jgi:hypothetical protein
MSRTCIECNNKQGCIYINCSDTYICIPKIQEELFECDNITCEINEEEITAGVITGITIGSVAGLWLISLVGAFIIALLCARRSYNKEPIKQDYGEVELGEINKGDNNPVYADGQITIDNALAGMVE